jgi:uncharacterized protein (TIGR03085 family)
MSFAASERAALCDLFDALGPDAPTLCAGWDTRDLAAHLHLRETSLLSAGILLPPVAGMLERRQQEVAGGDWPTLVARIRRPPFWSPSAIGGIDKRMNLAEYYVHHEDVRRAQHGWEPRELTPSQQRALWGVLQATARAHYRKAAVGVVLRREPDGAEITAKPGIPAVVVVGPPSELVLHAFGRTGQSLVRFEGPDEAVAELQETSLGI